jgi:hypothetical protein
MFLTWVAILCLSALTLIPELRHELYMAPAGIVIAYLFFNQYPWFTRRMHRRKLTYEDLEDFSDADPELRKRFQVVFTRIQQIGGSLCAGLLVMYAFHIMGSEKSVFEVFGVLGGLLSLYARIFGHVGNFCIACLYRLKKKHYDATCHPDGSTKNANPDLDKPQETKKSNYIL